MGSLVELTNGSISRENNLQSRTSCRVPRTITEGCVALVSSVVYTSTEGSIAFVEGCIAFVVQRFQMT